MTPEYRPAPETNSFAPEMYGWRMKFVFRMAYFSFSGANYVSFKDRRGVKTTLVFPFLREYRGGEKNGNKIASH